MGGGTRGSRPSYANSESKGTNLSNYISNDSNEPKVAFMSFHAEDIPQVNLLRQQAKDPRFGMEFIDNSVQEPFDSEWRTQTRKKILNSNIFIVLIGPETHRREAVNWEIKTAYQMGKSVIGIKLYRNKNHKIPSLMRENGAQIVNWSMEEISMAMENN